MKISICGYPNQLLGYSPVTLAAELDIPWVTFLTKAPTLPSYMSPDIPSDKSFMKPSGLPRKSTEPRIIAACHFSSWNF